VILIPELYQRLLHQCLLEHFLGMTGTDTTLCTDAQITFQITHPVSSPMHCLTDSAISYRFANTYIHIIGTPFSGSGISPSLLGQNQLAVTGTSQAVLLAMVLYQHFVPGRKQRITVNQPVRVRHSLLILAAGSGRGGYSRS
jgi:hypothetical protein